MLSTASPRIAYVALAALWVLARKPQTLLRMPAFKLVPAVTRAAVENAAISAALELAASAPEGVADMEADASAEEAGGGAAEGGWTGVDPELAERKKAEEEAAGAAAKIKLAREREEFEEEQSLQVSPADAPPLPPLMSNPTNSYTHPTGSHRIPPHPTASHRIPPDPTGSHRRRRSVCRNA
mgnify:CR=1 FL=1